MRYDPLVSGSRIKACREKAGLTQSSVAEQIGVKQPTIYQQENGKSKPTPEALVWYAQNYHVSVDYLLGLTDEPTYTHKVGGTIYFATEKKPPDLSDGEPPVYTEGTVTLDQDAPPATRREIEQIVRDQLRELLSGPSKNES